MKKYLLILIIFAFAYSNANAQIRISIPKIKQSEITKAEQPERKSQAKDTSSKSSTISFRQAVMDDAYTFFEAEPVPEYDQKLRLQKDIGWYLKSNLRLLGTFPRRSAFKILVKQNGKVLDTIRCEGEVYTKSGDTSIGTEALREGKDLNFEDFLYTSRCFDKESAIKETGKMNVEIHLIDGDTDEEKPVRTYKIDVHKATRVRGSAVKPQPDVSHYYIQRHAETPVAFIHITGNHTPSDRSGRKSYFLNDPSTNATPGYGQLVAYINYSPARSRKSVSSPFLRCSVNGQRIKLPNDRVSLGDVQSQSEYAIYTDRIAPEYKRGSPYRDDVKFSVLAASLPLYTGEGKYAKPPMKIEDHPGEWECSIVSNGETYRTFRWEVGSDGKMVPHAEQSGGNVNLFYKTYLVEMEIPEGGTPIDHRLMPMPNAGLFYGIPWTTAAGREMAGNVPKKGNPFHIPSDKNN